MPRRTLNIYYRDGYPTRVVTDDPSLRDVEINVITNDTPERLTFVSMVAEAEIERFCADQRSCKANTQWHGLSIAAECVGECLLAMRDQHYGDPQAMNAAIDEILSRFNAARAQAMEMRAAADDEPEPAAAARSQLSTKDGQALLKANGKGGLHQAA